MILQHPGFTTEKKFHHPLICSSSFYQCSFFWSISQIAGCGRLYRKSCKNTIEEPSREILIWRFVLKIVDIKSFEKGDAFRISILIAVQKLRGFMAIITSNLVTFWFHLFIGPQYFKINLKRMKRQENFKNSACFAKGL